MTCPKAFIVFTLFCSLEAQGAAPKPYLFAVTALHGQLQFLETSPRSKRSVLFRGNFFQSDDELSAIQIEPPFFTASYGRGVLTGIDHPEIRTFPEKNPYRGIPRAIQSIQLFRDPGYQSAGSSLGLPNLYPAHQLRSSAKIELKPVRMKNLKGQIILASFQRNGLLLVPQRIAYKRDGESGSATPFRQICENFKRSFYSAYLSPIGNSIPTDEAKLGASVGEIVTEETFENECFQSSTGTLDLASGVTQPEVQLESLATVTLCNISNGKFRTSRNARGQLARLSYHSNADSHQKFDLFFYEKRDPFGVYRPSEIKTQSGQEVLRVNQASPVNETLAFVKAADHTKPKTLGIADFFKSILTHQFSETYSIYSYEPREDIDYRLTKKIRWDDGYHAFLPTTDVHLIPNVITQPDQFLKFLGTFSITSEEEKFSD